MNASIYCAILKEKSGAPKEKIKACLKDGRRIGGYDRPRFGRSPCLQAGFAC